jgi:two-component system sensor histidine kinase AlgZ
VGAVTLRYLYIQFQWKRNLELETQARIQILQSRIRPHFLFNSMNTIASLTRTDPRLAERVVEDLAELFRLSLSDARVPVTLEQELDLCRRYLAIEALRLGQRLETSWSLAAAPLDALLPAFTVQPLLENAVNHGIEPSSGSGRLELAVSRGRHGIRVLIANPIPKGWAEGHREGNRMAQDNVRQRLRAFFGEAGRMRVVQDPGGYRVVLEFPYQTSIR